MEYYLYILLTFSLSMQNKKKEVKKKYRGNDISKKICGSQLFKDFKIRLNMVGMCLKERRHGDSSQEIGTYTMLYLIIKSKIGQNIKVILSVAYLTKKNIMSS